MFVIKVPVNFVTSGVVLKYKLYPVAPITGSHETVFCALPEITFKPTGADGGFCIGVLLDKLVDPFGMFTYETGLFIVHDPI